MVCNADHNLVHLPPHNRDLCTVIDNSYKRSHTSEDSALLLQKDQQHVSPGSHDRCRVSGGSSKTGCELIDQLQLAKSVIDAFNVVPCRVASI